MTVKPNLRWNIKGLNYWNTAYFGLFVNHIFTHSTYRSQVSDTCLSAGMNDYLPKPIDRKKLLAALIKASSIAPIYASEDETDDEDEGSVYLDTDMIDQLEEMIGSVALGEMLSMTLADAPATVALVSAAASMGDLDKMRKEVHGMGSNFGSYGATHLSDHARAIEKACREDNARKAIELAELLPEMVD